MTFKKTFMMLSLATAVLAAPFTVLAQGGDVEVPYADVAEAAVPVSNMSTDQLEADGCESRTPHKSTFGTWKVNAPANWQDWGMHAMRTDTWFIANETFYFCPVSVLSKYFNDSDEAVKQEFETAGRQEKPIIGILNGIFYVLAWIGAKLLWLASVIIVPLLKLSKFTRSDLVTAGWPFVQGIANLGFIFALLFIAVATTLRLDIGNPKRMLPRLLIAALLINFSLVIAGVIIDISRVLMAVMFNAIGGDKGGLDSLPYNMLESSKLVDAAFNAGTFRAEGLRLTAESNDWASVQSVVLATIFIWASTVAFLVIAAGLFIRYVALILLLIVSPIAYLALAFPGMQGVAKQWWSTFIKYVLYGPIMVFVLVLMVAAGNASIISIENKGDNNLAEAAVGVIMLLGLSISAAVAGSKLGAIGASATVGYVKKLPGMAYRNPKKTAAILAGVATGGAGYGVLAAGAAAAGAAGGAKAAGMTGRAAYLRGRDFTKEATKPVRKKFGVGEYSTYDEKGKLRPGKTSIGKQLGRYVSGDAQKDAGDARRIAALGAISAANVDNNNLLPTQLAKGHILNALASHPTLGHRNVNRVAGFGSSAQQMAIARSKDYIRRLNTSELADLQVAIRGNTTVSTGDQAKAIDRLHQTLDEIDKE